MTAHFGRMFSAASHQQNSAANPGAYSACDARRRHGVPPVAKKKLAAAVATLTAARFTPAEIARELGVPVRAVRRCA